MYSLNQACPDPENSQLSRERQITHWMHHILPEYIHQTCNYMTIVHHLSSVQWQFYARLWPVGLPWLSHREQFTSFSKPTVYEEKTKPNLRWHKGEAVLLLILECAWGLYEAFHFRKCWNTWRNLPWCNFILISIRGFIRDNCACENIGQNVTHQRDIHCFLNNKHGFSHQLFPRFQNILYGSYLSHLLYDAYGFYG